jgi:hypothetical protein
MVSQNLLERMVSPIIRVLTPEAAREILNIRADDQTQQRIDELADKCNEGILTAEERTEYQEFVSMFNMLTLLQAKARVVLDADTGQRCG